VLVIAGALSGCASVGPDYTQQGARVQAAQRALDIANLRYTSGLGTYLDVLDAQRQLFSAQVDLAGTTRDQLTAVVQVYKALGGGREAQR
jgi:outer membrane protein, multidrug efflux system